MKFTRYTLLLLFFALLVFGVLGQVFQVQAAQPLRQIPNYRGALVRKTYPTNQLFYSQVNSNLTWSMVDRDTDGFFNASYPTRLTIPAGSGITKVRLIGSGVWGQNGSGMRQLVIKKNGAFAAGMPVNNTMANPITTTDLQVYSAVIDVIGGDYFEMEGYQSSGSSLYFLASTGSWFELEVIR